MTQFDIIIISYASTKENKAVTDDCIASLLESQKDGYIFQPIVVEQNKNVRYKNAITVHYNFDFNYNKCLNLGLSHSVAPFKGLCNNDLIFHTDWVDGIHITLTHGYGSASPFCLKTHTKFYPPSHYILSGYKVGKQLAGWCFFMTDETLSKIGKLHEGVSFWYSDNIYAEQLKKAGIKHGLVCNSFVTHIESHTLNQTSLPKYRQMTGQQKRLFEKAMADVWSVKPIEQPYENTWRGRKKKWNVIKLNKKDGTEKEGTV